MLLEKVFGFKWNGYAQDLDCRSSKALLISQWGGGGDAAAYCRTRLGQCRRPYLSLLAGRQNQQVS